MFQSKKIATIMSVTALVSMLSVSAFAADKAQAQPTDTVKMTLVNLSDTVKSVPATEITVMATALPEGAVEMTKIELATATTESIPATPLVPATSVK